VCSRSGAWHVFQLTGNSRYDVQTRVFGESVWKNPRGYLPGSLQPILPFHASISLLYVLIGLTWLGVHFLHRNPVLPQQQLVSLTLMLGMLESCIDYSDSARLNATGRPNYALQGGSNVVSAAYKSSLWLTILLLARGFGSVRTSGYERYPLLLGAILAACHN
jgi:Lung seven transmembrane receptor